jgi:hypothetical protein
MLFDKSHVFSQIKHLVSFRDDKTLLFFSKSIFESDWIVGFYDLHDH